MKNKDLKNFYDGVYARDESHHYTKLRHTGGGLSMDKQAVLEELSWKGKMVLDVGCGTGETAYHIAKKGARRVVGLDYSYEAIAAARRAYRHPNLFFEKKDVRDCSEKFDIVIAMGTLEHIDDPFSLLKKFKAMLSPGGSIIITSPNWTNPRGYILMALWRLFGAKITLADIHYFTPLDFEAFTKKLGMRLSWRTTEHDWAHGARMTEDFTRRLPRVFRDSKLRVTQKKINEFIRWLSERAVPLERDTPHGGAIGLYHFRK